MPGTIFELRKFVVPEYVFGLDAISLSGQYAANYGARKALIVTDKGVIKAGWVSKVTESLQKQNIPYEIFSEISPNPRDFEVMNGADVYATNHCNVIIAVGGGSPMDCAKGIGIVCTNKKHILDFEGIDQVKSPMPPLICIPTTGGTSADVSQFAIITDSTEKNKIAIISKAVVPDVALIDPSTLTTMDSYLTACTGIDALVHAIEAFVSNASSSSTDLHAQNAIRLIYDNLLLSISDPQNMQYRADVMFASLQAGMAFSNASLGAVHAMAHSLGGYLDLPHGECNALLLTHVMNFNFNEATDRFDRIGNVIGLNLKGMTVNQKKERVIKSILDLREKAGIVDALGVRGVKSADIPQLAKKAINDACIVTNPRQPNLRDIEVIYEEAL